jgi:hypothetical protein
MTASDILIKAAHLIRTQLACDGIVGEALYHCGLTEATAHEPPSVTRATIKFRCHALMRQFLLGDPGPGDLSGKLNSMTAQAIVDAMVEAAGELNTLRLEGFDPSAARKVPHWSNIDED